MEKIKVIIVDDNMVINQMVKSGLEECEDINVLGCAYSDEEEISMIDNLKPDIVITDLVRNGNLSGVDIIRKYKSQGKFPKFIVITANSNDVNDFKLIDGIIYKPFKDCNMIIKEIRRIKEQIKFENLPIEKSEEIAKTNKSIFYKIIEIIRKKVNNKK